MAGRRWDGRVITALFVRCRRRECTSDCEGGATTCEGGATTTTSPPASLEHDHEHVVEQHT
eukprot:CAMPEP_0202793378 /NCGR_PEP_ID=MMETSP1388-20130828/85725_1 /ASSEMBLY_ACC=CAM_ASM_000864 /TAXON_ID=37098 /ORGANISM="Isochrysis sp, Strain CCMP1244" /LENGTH=60 /DNA_ID=CAMNT_0049463189 /DNA_START=58 /DNA_END=237 /DNA_ORIENTATION=+